MTWIVDNPISWMQRIAINVIKTGPLPRHVGFIMDGNRRYAAKRNVQKIEGHSKGFEKLSETLQWCRLLGITEVTVYAFSIENFKRRQDEVDTLMEIARDKFARLLEEREQLMENGVCIRVIGKLSLLPPDIRKLIAKAVIMTKDNTSAYLNVAFAYTSREEITTAVDTIVQGVQQDSLSAEDVNEQLFSNCLYTNKSSDPDILVRTSGEVRFSDFLLWQISSTYVSFAEVFWPEFNIWHLLYAVFMYQRNYKTLEDIKFEKAKLSPASTPSEQCKTFIHNLDSIRWEKLHEYANA